MKVSVYKSDKAKNDIRSYYTAILTMFPFEQLFIETSLGKTFILAYGSEDNPPAALLHGSCSNSVFMSPEILALASAHRVYAVDIIGEAGNSEEYRPPLDTDAFALWLYEVFDGLKLSSVVLMGNSLGGWLALKFSVTFPDKVRQLIVIAPSGLSDQNTEYLNKAAYARETGGELTLDDTVTGGAAMPKEVADFVNLILSGYNPITEMLPVFTDDQLSRLNMPVLFIGGENDAMVDTAASVMRLKRLVPHTQINVLKQAGHIVMNSLDYVLLFLNAAGGI